MAPLLGHSRTALDPQDESCRNELTIETVIERAVRNAAERLGRATVPAPAYAVAIFSHDPDELAAANIVIGLERDREATLRDERGDRSRRAATHSHRPGVRRGPGRRPDGAGRAGDLVATAVHPQPRGAAPRQRHDAVRGHRRLRFSARPEALAELERKGLI